jgi:hypothetical protein
VTVQVRGATVIYATHIFDGLDDWPSHLHYIANEGTSYGLRPISHGHVLEVDPWTLV